jgi:hypothetical protein
MNLARTKSERSTNTLALSRVKSKPFQSDLPEAPNSASIRSKINTVAKSSRTADDRLSVLCVEQTAIYQTSKQDNGWE